MTIYITQGRYTEHAMKRFLRDPDDRAEPARRLIEAAGGKLLHYFITLGEYDFMVIAEVEGEDPSGYLATLLAAGGTGGITGLKTTVAISTKDAVKAMEKGQMLVRNYRAAGS